MGSVPVEPHGRRVDSWRQRVRGGSAADRRLSEVVVAMPPRIGSLVLGIPGDVGARMESAVREMTALDQEHGDHLGALSALLLRAESVASSKIEQIEASVDDYARALHGIRSNSSATSMVASTRALGDLIGSVHLGERISLAGILRAHRILMADDPSERAYAGRLRDLQNWIGGSDHSPRGALYVPPPPGGVAALLEDLLDFAARDDLGALAQAAVVHAQFESIHPFTDGNGRIGRALINSVLRRRGVTHRVVVPLASALVARRDDYFGTLAAYRAGDAGPIIDSFATASLIAARESRVTAKRVSGLPDTWRAQAGRPRSGSAPSKVLEALLAEPVFSADDLVARVGGSPSSVYAAVARLHRAEIIRPLTTRTRNQVWVAAALADELDDLGVRIAMAARGSGLSADG